jgi:hypothetical protein
LLVDEWQVVLVVRPAPAPIVAATDDGRRILAALIEEEAGEVQPAPISFLPR